MIVRDFYFVGVSVDESKTDTPLLVDGYGVLSLTVFLQLV